jgi:hypothetical protein
MKLILRAKQDFVTNGQGKDLKLEE